jgi:protein-serine/threonine kinase
VELLLKRQSLDRSIRNRFGQIASELSKEGEITRMFSEANLALQTGSIPIIDLRSSFSEGEKVGCEDFTVHGMIGKGSFGEVFFVQRKDTEEVFAMKVLHKSKIVSKLGGKVWT